MECSTTNKISTSAIGGSPLPDQTFHNFKPPKAAHQRFSTPQISIRQSTDFQGLKLRSIGQVFVEHALNNFFLIENT